MHENHGLNRGGEYNMKDVLWISLMVPYDTVSHASGKTQNWYLKRLAKEKEVKLRLATFCKPNELEKIDLDSYGIVHNIYVRPRGGVINEIKRAIAWMSKLEVWNKYAGLTTCDYRFGIKKIIRELDQENYKPNVVIMQWTEIVFFLPIFKKKWPDAKFIAIEEDVSYLGMQRKRDFYKNLFQKTFFAIKARKVRNLEIKCLNECDFVIFNNEKDYKLSCSDGYIGKNMIWSVFYQNFSDRKLKNQNSKEIVFYGAMAREENWKSCVWFIENVMPRIKDKEIKFVIVGSGPKAKLLSYANDRVVIKGFVEDVGEELESAMCLVAPLVMGAGIKVKILEAMSLGIPVLTNSIGIEGIPMTKNVDYYHCEEPQEYVDAINMICENRECATQIGDNAKQKIISIFNYEDDAVKFIEKILCL